MLPNEIFSPMFLGITGSCSLILFIIMIVGQWKIFEKSGEQGWKSLIPLYNVYKLVEIATGNGIKMLLMFIPIVGIAFSIIIIYKLCKSFGYGIGMTILYFLATPVAVLTLGFGDNDYDGPY